MLHQLKVWFWVLVVAVVGMAVVTGINAAVDAVGRAIRGA